MNEGGVVFSLLYSSVVAVFGALVLFTTFAPLAPTQAWWVRGWDFPRVQILILGCIVIVAAFFVVSSWKWGLIASLVIACIYQSVRILPYTPLYPKEMSSVEHREDGSQLVILASNVEEPNDQHDRVRALIDDVDADVVFLMETDKTWFDALSEQLDSYDTVVSELRDNYYGMIFATRLKVHQAQIVYLTPDETPTLFAELETPDGHRFRLVGLHPRPPVPGNSTEDRDAQIIYAARFAREINMPLIAVGDFNDAAWSDTSRRFKKVGGYVDPRVGRGMIASFDAKSRLLRAPIDQFYATPDIGLVDFGRGPNVGSDHFPIITRIELDPKIAGDANVAPPPMPDTELEELDRIMTKYRKSLDARHLPDFD